MVCSKCGKENKEAAVWCGECGEKLFIGRTDYACSESTEQNPFPKNQASKNAAFKTSTEKTYCVGCGKERKETDEFCGGCGNKLAFIKQDHAISVESNVIEDVLFKSHPPEEIPSQRSNAVKKNPIDVIYLLIIVLPIIIAIYMMISVHNNFNSSSSSENRAHNIEQLTQELNNVKSMYHEKMEKLKQVAEIGPEPHWLNIPGHYAWKKKKELKEKIEIELMQLKSSLDNTEIKLKFERILATKENAMKNIFKDLWDSYIQPVLEFFLIWAIFLFSINRFCRFILIKGYLGVTKV